jgi:hypothetical protein
MTTSLNIINEIEVATPCPASWEQMLGDDKVRFCGQCEKNVYNFSSMTAQEIADLVEETEGVFCGRLFRRPDGTVLTADCPVGLAEKARIAARRAARRGLALAGLLTVSLAGGALGFFSKSAKQACDNIKPVISDWSHDNVAGGIAVDVDQLKKQGEMGEPTVKPVEPVLERMAPRDPKPVIHEHVAGGMRVPPQMLKPRPPKMGKVKAPTRR